MTLIPRIFPNIAKLSLTFDSVMFWGSLLIFNAAPENKEVSLSTAILWISMLVCHAMSTAYACYDLHNEIQPGYHNQAMNCNVSLSI